MYRDDIVYRTDRLGNGDNAQILLENEYPAFSGRPLILKILVGGIDRGTNSQIRPP